MQLFGLHLSLEPANPAAALHAELALLSLAGAIRKSAGGYALTNRGMYLWVVIMREFFTAVNRFRDQMRAHIRDEYESVVESIHIPEVVDQHRHP
ncbi:MAG: hypothetical protein HUJ31_08955 [Pseudomonadales bacterium]|nr:hypothetical protein [Pseudomonadales bacterium]